MALQSKTFKSGYSNGFYSQLTVSEDSTNVNTNTSTISYTLSLYSTNMNFSDYSIGYYVKLGGSTLVNVARAGSKQWTLGTNSHIDLYKGAATIAHDADGSKNMSVEFFISVYPMYYTPGDITVSGQSMALTAIPRATTFSSVPGSVNIGSICAIKLSRKSTAYTHTITYKFGSLSGTVASASTAETVSFTVPTTFYAQIPNAASGTCTLTCTTYSGSTVIGSAQTASFTAVANVKPTVSGTVVDSNATTKALTGDQNKLVRYYSTASCTISAAAGTGATVADKTVNGLAVSGATLSIPNVDTGSFLFSVRDSRGATQTATVTKTVVQYVKLTVNGALARTAPTASTARLTLTGNYFNASFGTTANTLSVTYKTKPAGGSYGSAVTVTPTKSGNTWSAAVTVSGLAYTSAYTVSVTATDKLGSVTKEFALTRGTPVFDWGQSDFSMNVPFNAAGGATVSGNPALHTGLVKDYVTQQGTSGIWTYRKWNSGLVECWADTTISPGTLNASGSFYYSNVIRLNLPLSVKPLSITGTVGNLFWLCNPDRASGTVGFRVARAANWTGTSVDVMLYVVGI